MVKDRKRRKRPRTEHAVVRDGYGRQTSPNRNIQKDYMRLAKFFSTEFRGDDGTCVSWMHKFIRFKSGLSVDDDVAYMIITTRLLKARAYRSFAMVSKRVRTYAQLMAWLFATFAGVPDISRKEEDLKRFAQETKERPRDALLRWQALKFDLEVTLDTA